MLWNSFPFHPHKLGNERSNRKPTPEEIDKGKIYLTELIAMFKIKKIVAVGKIAEGILKALYGQETVTYLRHPANGGATRFRSGLKDLKNK